MGDHASACAYDEWGEPISVKRKGRGIAAHTQKLLEHAIAVVKEMQPIAVRQVAYQLLVRGIIPSMAERETKRMSRLLVYAREQGLIPWAHIVDESRRLERPLSFDNVPDFVANVRHWFRRDYWATQPYCVQVWSEKNTAAGILRPLLDEYGVPFMIVHGFGSCTAVQDVAAYSKGDPREHVILYCGDHDPSGMCMSERDIPKRMREYGGRVTVRRVALVASDLPNLPPNPDSGTKKDANGPWYREHYGKLEWELDALDPNIIRDRLEAVVLEYIEPHEWQRIQLVEKAEKRTVYEMAEALGRKKGTG